MDLTAIGMIFGPTGVLLIAVVIAVWRITKWDNKREQKIIFIEKEIKDMQETLDTVHDGCHIPQGALENVKTEITLLKEKDTQIEVDLIGIRSTVNSNNVLIGQLHAHFLHKGLNADADVMYGRRKGDDE